MRFTKYLILIVALYGMAEAQIVKSNVFTRADLDHTDNKASARALIGASEWMNDVLRTNAFSYTVAEVAVTTNTVRAMDTTAATASAYNNLINGWGWKMRRSYLADSTFDAVAFKGAYQDSDATNVATHMLAWIGDTTGVEDGSAPTNIVALGWAELSGSPPFATNTTVVRLLSPATLKPIDLTTNDLTEPYFVAWTFVGTAGGHTNIQAPDVSRLYLLDPPDDYATNALYRMVTDDSSGTNVLVGWRRTVTSPYCAPIGLYDVVVTDRATNYTLVNGKLPASITNELHAATSNINILDSEMDAAESRLASLESAQSLALPPTIWGVEGLEMHCYFAGLVPGDWRDWVWDATATSYAGTNYVEDWRDTPAAAWSRALSVSQFTGRATNAVAMLTATNLLVACAASKTGTNIVLPIGDSTTAGSDWIIPLEAIDTSDGNVDVTTIGTKTDNGYSHEGISGWTTALFVGPTSPFWDGAAFSMEYYLTNNALATPTHVIIKLGINDLFSYTSDSSAQSAITSFISNLNTMLGSITNDLPTVKIGICTVEPGSRDQDAWGTNYASSQTGYRARRNYWMLNRVIISTYGGRESDGIYVVPTNICIDDYYGYSRTTVAVNSRVSTTIARMSNGVHPGTDGNKQVADCIWSWLKNNP